MKSESPAVSITTNCRVSRALSLASVACAWVVLPAPALAYVGPGAGLSAIGIVVGLIAAVLLGIVGFVWYPIKRLLKLRRKRPAEPEPGAESGDPPPKEP